MLALVKPPLIVLPLEVVGLSRLQEYILARFSAYADLFRGHFVDMFRRR